MSRFADWIGRNKDVLFVAAILAILTTIFVPLPPFVLDFLLVISVTLYVGDVSHTSTRFTLNPLPGSNSTIE